VASWQIHVPFSARSDSLVDVAAAARELATDEARNITRQLVLDEITTGSSTSAGELLDAIAAEARSSDARA
jgi:hypothetical protein